MSLPFRVIDTFTARSDLAQRKEIKFLLPAADVGKLRRLLMRNCRPIVHNRPVSEVYSVYFDDLRLAACHANLDGLGSRRKLRLRWYDARLPGNDFYFEVKWRESRITGKHRLRIESQRPLAEMSYAEIDAGLRQVLPQRFAPTLETYPEPTLLVRYKRQHFQTDDGSVRLTVDYDVGWVEQVGRPRITAGFASSLPEMVVLEAKAAPGLERRIRRLLEPLPVRATRSSKYVTGCQLVGLLDFPY